MPSFLPGYAIFALAGAVAAIGPIVIHLLNRRRFRVISWAAMDFLREAVKRNRRILKLRDILLLILRTAAVLLFGLALARPYFASAGGGQVNPGQSVHAILLVDNSMSMGYRQAGQTVLDEAKSKARELIEALPDGSRFTVLPLCGGGPFSRDAYRTKQGRHRSHRRNRSDRSGDDQCPSPRPGQRGDAAGRRCPQRRKAGRSDRRSAA